MYHNLAKKAQHTTATEVQICGELLYYLSSCPTAQMPVPKYLSTTGRVKMSRNYIVNDSLK